mgnify:CR=1 FL=1
MPISKSRLGGLYLSLSITAAAALWFNQDSVETYWQQQYHQASPFAALRQYEWWTAGAQWRHRLFAQEENATIFAESNETTAEDNLIPPLLAPAADNNEHAAIELAEISSENLNPPSALSLERLGEENSLEKPIIETNHPLEDTATLTLESLSEENSLEKPITETNHPLEDTATLTLESLSEENTSDIPITEISQAPENAAVLTLESLSEENTSDIPITEISQAPENAAVLTLESLNEESRLENPIAETQPADETIAAQNIAPEPDSNPSLESEAPPNLPAHTAAGNDKILLDAGDHVLFIGDSMMQSFAPHMQKWLKNEHHINSNNLGRHSTGLSNQQYYDWPLEAEKRIAATPQLKLVVVMMGANDPWNIETASKRVLNFKSPEWAAEYGARALRIVAAAKRQGAEVIWIGLPHMRLAKYNPKIRFLDDTLAQHLAGQVIYIRSHELLDGGSGKYRDSIEKDGKLIRVRHKDGIHLNAAGELLILEEVKKYISF